MADVDPFAQYVQPEPKAAGDDPFAAYVAPDGPAPAAAAPQPSRLERATAALGRAGSAVGGAFKEMGQSALEANRTVANAIVHPIDTYRSLAANPGASLREAMRGVNSNIPFANRAVQAMGGPPAESPEDAAASPMARTLGSVAGLPVAGMTGDIAATAVRGVLDKAATASAARAERKAFQDLGRGAGSKAQAKLEQLGPEATGAVDREFGISKSADPRQAIKSARATVGAARDAANRAIEAAGGDVDMAAVTKRLDDLQTDFAAKAGTRPFAGDVAKLRTDLLKQYGSAGKVSAAQLQEEISAINDGAYGGNYANPKTAQIVQRRTAGALKDTLNESLDATAARGPDLSAAVQAVREANQKFAVLKTMEPIAKARAGKAAFAPTFTDKLIDAPAKTLAHAGKDMATGAVDRTLATVGRAAGSALPDAATVANSAHTANPAKVAMLIQAARAGATRQQLQLQAQNDGVPIELADNIAMQSGR